MMSKKLDDEVNLQFFFKTLVYDVKNQKSYWTLQIYWQHLSSKILLIDDVTIESDFFCLRFQKKLFKF